MKFQKLQKTRFTLTVIVLYAMVGIVFPVHFLSQVETGQVQEIQAESGKFKLSFEENRGQFHKDVRFAARAAGANVFLTATEAVYVLPVPEARDNCGILGFPNNKAFALRMKIAGANADSAFRGEEILDHRTNYFRGAKESNWKTNVPNYAAARFENVYDGISMIWRGQASGAARYDFEVAPGAQPGQIRLEFDGADALEIDAEGNLLIKTAVGTIKQSKPFTYQETDGFRREIESGFTIEENIVKFALGEYDHSKTLVIDPTVTLNNLAFSTFLGSFADDIANDIAVDANGNSYVTGRTLSPSFPTTSGVFDATANGAEDVFVTKLNAGGTGLVFSTFLGGNFYDEGKGIAVDETGNVYVTGQSSVNFPVTAGAFDTTFNGGTDVFITKLNQNGSALVYSTYIGESGIDSANDLAIDAAGNAYIVVRTPDTAVDYPTTAGAFDTTHNGFDDVAVTKLNPTGTSLVYSTFLGGSSLDVGHSIAVNSAGEAYIGGATTDDVVDFPVTAGAYDTTHNGVTDFFVTRLNSDGSNLIFSTFIGGAGIDNGAAIAIDNAGNAYIGGSVSAGFPTTAGVFDTTAAGSTEIGVSKISASGANLLYSTYLGGTQGETVGGVAVDAFGNAYVAGNNFGGDYPTTAGAFDTTYNGSNDAILTVLNSNASALVYSTYLGGGGSEFANDVALDSVGNVYLAGQTALNAAAFPTTNQAFQTFNGGGLDAFVGKFGDFSIGGKVIDTNGNPVSNVMVALSGQVSANTLTGADGRFGFLDTVPFEAHTISAMRSGYTINPPLFNITNLNNNRELIFLAQPGSPTGGAGGVLRMANLSYNKSENAASVTVTVNRTGTILTTDPVTVDFTTENGTANAGQDYAQTSGILTFNPLETTKTITVPIVNDSILEPKEFFKINLSNPTNNAEIETGRGSTNVQILDEDLSGGDLVISEFRQRGRLGANDEYVKLFNPHDFDITINAADGSNGLTLAHASGADFAPVLTIPNLVTIRSRGHYLLTNNNPNGGFSIIDYPTGTGTTTTVGDQTFSENIPDNSSLVLLKTANAENFNGANLLDAVGFYGSQWKEGKGLSIIAPENSEMSFVRKLKTGGVQDTNDNAADFLLVDNHARTFDGGALGKIFSALGAPAPENSESLRLMTDTEVSIETFGAEIYDSQPVENGAQGTLTIYRRITNNTDQPILALRLRAIDFATAGTLTQRRFSSRPDFRLFSSRDENETLRGATLAAERLQPNGGGINSTLTIDSITPNAPLLPDQSVVVAIRFGVMRYGRHRLALAVEALQ